VLSNSSDDNEAVLPDQPTGRDSAASSSRDLEEEEEHIARLEAERRSKFNTECASRWPEAETPHGKGPAGESSTPPPPASALPGKRGWVKCNAS
jgi:hypothetical protein